MTLRDLAVMQGADTGSALLRQMESIEQAVAFNPEAGLDWLSARTGGFVVRDTNDLTDAVWRVDDDLRSYYLLGYTPSNERWDGRFRELDVKVRRKGVKVRSRSGYFAVRSEGPVLAHVAPALALLENRERPRSFPVFAGALPFPAGEAAARVSLVVGAPGEGVVESVEDAERIDLTLLARVLDGSGRPVDATSRRVVIDPEDPNARGTEHRLLRDVWLAPGRYTLESVAYEAGTRVASVTTIPFEVPAGQDPVERAQVMLIRETLPAGEETTSLSPGHPLLYGEVVLYPSVGEPVEPASGRPLVFQVVAPGGEPPPPGTLSLWQGERRLGGSAVAWVGPGEDGLYRFVGELPVAGLVAGPHELRVELEGTSEPRTLVAPFDVRR